jgi:hypothetical protein
MNHALKMIIGCVLPLLVIFVLPLFGISEGLSLFMFIVLMFACHLMMMRGHEGEHEEHRFGPEPEEHHESP